VRRSHRPSAPGAAELLPAVRRWAAGRRRDVRFTPQSQVCPTRVASFYPCGAALTRFHFALHSSLLLPALRLDCARSRLALRKSRHCRRLGKACGACNTPHSHTGRDSWRRRAWPRRPSQGGGCRGQDPACFFRLPGGRWCVCIVCAQAVSKSVRQDGRGQRQVGGRHARTRGRRRRARSKRRRGQVRAFGTVAAHAVPAGQVFAEFSNPYLLTIANAPICLRSRFLRADILTH
jgi:hypothetical protein